MNSGLAAKSHLLDLGCGWGLSSEFFAYSGLHVTALDISSSFVELVNTRAKQKNLTIEAVQGSFDNVPSGPFDAATYYECLHHAVKLWDALSSVARVIRPGGKVMIVGEPINNTWRHWGLRKDPLSIYCIRKFGWFESGWRLAFLQKCLDTCGFNLSYCAEAGEKIGWVIVAERRGYI
jgi:ubiquinone/menaquinone biosynthesis C-methylase UbiE